jgi:hypothetical protein
MHGHLIGEDVQRAAQEAHRAIGVMAGATTLDQLGPALKVILG